MGEPDKAGLVASAKRLNELAAELDRRGFAVRVLATNGKVRAWVQNPAAPEFSDAVYAWPDDVGDWWLWWSWAARIALIDDVKAAADTIACVLTPHEWPDEITGRQDSPEGASLATVPAWNVHGQLTVLRKTYPAFTFAAMNKGGKRCFEAVRARGAGSLYSVITTDVTELSQILRDAYASGQA
jgi:hypothetical protein